MISLLKNITTVTSLLLFLSDCDNNTGTSIFVSNYDELNTAIENSKAGDHIVLANGG